MKRSSKSSSVVASIAEVLAQQTGDLPVEQALVAIEAGMSRERETDAVAGSLQSAMDAADAVAQTDRALASMQGSYADDAAAMGASGAADVPFDDDVDAAVRQAEQATASVLAASSDTPHQ